MDQAKTHVRAAACAVVFVWCGGSVAAQDGRAAAPDDDRASVARMCLDNPTIKRTQILGDRNIVFITRDNQIYNNQLPRQCPSLRRSSLVNYPVANRELCAGGQFQVLWQTGLGNYTPAFTCQLGAFVPITEAELEDLATLTDENPDRRRLRRRSPREAVISEEVELPPPAERESPAAPAAPAE
jgi:hypothetical protein